MAEVADGVIAPVLTRKTRPATYPTLLQNPYAERILRDFRLHAYREANPDLRLEDSNQALWHLVYNGFREHRLFDLERVRRLDPSYYRRRYPELELASDAEAQMHYCYIGYYEDRFANADTEWLCNADLHIFQPGKVGSSAIAKTLEGRYPGNVLHLHWPTDMALHYPACSLTHASLVNHPRERPLRVISAGRELVSRVLSGMCQYLDTVGRKAGVALHLDHAIAYLEDAFMHDCDVITGWFDHRFHCGLNIYAHRFDHEHGYVHLRNGIIDLFLYRQEDLVRIERPLAEFLGLPDFRLSRHNTAESKGYQWVYREMMARFVIPRPILEELYATPYMRFFYSEDERARMMEHWARPRDAHALRTSPCRESRQ